VLLSLIPFLIPPARTGGGDRHTPSDAVWGGRKRSDRHGSVVSRRRAAKRSGDVKRSPPPVRRPSPPSHISHPIHPSDLRSIRSAGSLTWEPRPRCGCRPRRGWTPQDRRTQPCREPTRATWTRTWIRAPAVAGCVLVKAVTSERHPVIADGVPGHMRRIRRFSAPCTAGSPHPSHSQPSASGSTPPASAPQAVQKPGLSRLLP